MGDARAFVGMALTLACSLLAASSAAQSSPPRSVQVAEGACAAVSRDDVMAVLRVELGARLVGDGSARDDAYRVDLECSGDRVVVAVSSRGRARESFATSLAGSPPNVRPRVVALGIAEFVRELDRTAPPAPPPPPPPPVAPPAPPAPATEAPPAAPARALRETRLAAFAQTSSFRFDGVWLSGGGLRFDYAYRRWSLGFDAAFVTAAERSELGTAYPSMGYGAPYLAWREVLGPFQSRVGAGFAMGVAKVSAHATDARALASSVAGPWGAPNAFVSLGVRIAGGLDLEAKAQMGWVVLPVVGEVTRGADVTLDGAWTSLQLGASLALDSSR